ncbi:3-keto-disaccharide hydrolase [Prosthecobacter fusiformis]|uniref:3-keto-disaccharide hydrolase n=1 Tax=Prosthecobacter fusiformis TaxID=48464 RepID=UPI001FB9CE36|nr:DUF1080 domain-containing protein [Prosthecobacter fusiformis]
MTTPAGQAAWLGVKEEAGHLSAEVLWGRGSVLPADMVFVNEGVLNIQRTIPGKKSVTRQTLTATVHEEGLRITSVITKEDGTEIEKGVCEAARLAAIPARPDLNQVQWDDPVPLIAPSGLDGWQLVEEGAPNGWAVKDGVLSNRVTKINGKRYGNLRTQKVFNDFKLTAEVRTLPESNSGIYLRGIYEIQIAESFGKPLNSHHMGALYTRITPAVAAEKPPGEWQTLEIILVARHVTVVLNGKTLMDNQPALGCTGGALTSDDSQAGPIMLQGDHSDIDYRNMVLTPVRQ